MILRPTGSTRTDTLLPSTTLFRSKGPSGDGIKTGHTSEAGYCLLTSAVRDGRRLISAVMGTKSWAAREQSSLELLNYGFRFFDTTSLFGPGKPAQNARVYKGKLDSIARSEEHTSELQSLMRISYAVFC